MERSGSQLPVGPADLLSGSPIAPLGEPAVATPVESPCVSTCRIDPAAAICTGCGRTLEEIACWSTGTSHWRAEVMTALAGRLADLKPRAGR
ncbi:DUF1289 domain-containing protein [Sphingomonas sp. TREG-RG-20F-R18-01]|uniref:DUF1289 domain-containing protein n=1 Tax=Sphingomonas sp. TREG-RG-20F-R18-01 TaxID=2914982 RepID=UPI003221DF74